MSSKKEEQPFVRTAGLESHGLELPVQASDLPAEADGLPVETTSEVPSARPRTVASRLRKFTALIVAAAIFLLQFAAKLKFLLLLLPKVKFFATAITMVLSIGAYALLFPFWFAVGFVVLIWIHEMGHVIQLRREGIKASAPMFIPFLGAFVAMKEMPRDAAVEAKVGLAGPILGTLGALGAWALYLYTGHQVLLGLAYTGFFLNLFNLLPMLPLDGGRAMAALSPKLWFAGLLGCAALLFFRPNPVLILILIIGGLEMWRRWKARNEPEQERYFQVEPAKRWAIGLTYFGLAVMLVVFMGATHIEAPI